MTPGQCLHFHQIESGPLMDELFEWLNKKMGNKEAEPNSTLGKAIQYMLIHWQELTLFLRVENAPLDKRVDACSYKQQWPKNNLVFHVRHCQQSYCLKLSVKFFQA